MRLITRIPSIGHNTPIPQHQLPVKYHINFKNLILALKSLLNLAPPYLSDVLHMAAHSHTLRSSSSINLIIPSARLTTMGFRAFS